ncbi:MAG TPA: 16S rRNA (guanine(527)-N(7))-methyltransferase RsmG [Blastocatellia bacterium]|nr:16S rRNA (guanine(527)-N(7))-methyltransferase RsmG [Blastocatellia bacterium]
MRRSEREREFVEHLVRLAPHFGLELSAEVLEKLASHYSLILRWNERVNLTSTLEPAEIAQFHYLESLYGATLLKAEHVVDIGSGAGFPGLVMAVFWPELKVTLIERNRKRAVFLQEALFKLGLARANVFFGCYQEYPSRDFDAVTCRALDRMRQELPSLLRFGSSTRQILIFGTPVLASWVEKAAQGNWTVSRYKIPLSRERILTILHRN